MVLYAGICRFLVCLSVFLIYPLSFSLCFKLGSSSVLLAYNLGLPSNYTLELTDKADECYQWRSENSEIVRVIPVFSEGDKHLLPNCTKKVILVSVANFLERRVTKVSVTTANQKTIYCDVITDAVASIELEWLTDDLVLGGPPQKISVIAKDMKGHKFTSINGLQIKYSVTHELRESTLVKRKQSEENKVIRISRFDVSDYEYPENEFENRGLLSSSILVEPLELGTAVIRASLLESSVPVLTAEVKLNIVSSLKTYPSSPLYLLRNTSVKLNLENYKKENEDINLEDFTVDIHRPELIKLSEDKLHLHAKEYGSTSISYTNKNNGDKVLLDLHTVKLNHIGLRISGGNYNILEEMKMYEFRLDLYDKDGNQIYVSDNLRFSVSFPTKLFHVIFTSSNGSYSVVQTIAPGHGKIRVEFKGVVLEDESISKEYAISEKFDVKVLQKINILPPFTLLPVLFQERPMHRIRLTVTGGTGEYVWALSNYKVAKVIPDEENNNVVQLEVYEEVHDLTVTVTDSNNVNFVSTAKVSVQSPLDIEVYPTVTEAEVGNVLIIPTALLGYENKEKEIIRKFDDCSKADIKVDIIEKHVLSFEKEADIPAFGKGCVSLEFRCKMAGYTRVNMDYVLIKNNMTLKTTTVMACYKTLKPVHPVRVAMIALGTSFEIAFEGGPRKWPLFKEGHYTELEASNPDTVKMQLVKDPIRYNSQKALLLGTN